MPIDLNDISEQTTILLGDIEYKMHNFWTISPWQRNQIDKCTQRLESIGNEEELTDEDMEKETINLYRRLAKLIIAEDFPSDSIDIEKARMIHESFLDEWKIAASLTERVNQLKNQIGSESQPALLDSIKDIPSKPSFMKRLFGRGG